MKACKDYIESELKKGTKKSKIEEHLRKEYREGLWKSQLEQYPEPGMLEKNKILNIILMIYVSLWLLFVIVTTFIYYFYINPKNWAFILLSYRSLYIILPIAILDTIRKGLVSGYYLALLLTFLILVFGIMRGYYFDILITLPIGIIGFILARKIHPDYNPLDKFKKKPAKT
jgi:hypothetical protein